MWVCSAKKKQKNNNLPSQFYFAHEKNKKERSESRNAHKNAHSTRSELQTTMHEKSQKLKISCKCIMRINMWSYSPGFYQTSSLEINERKVAWTYRHLVASSSRTAELNVNTSGSQLSEAHERNGFEWSHCRYASDVEETRSFPRQCVRVIETHGAVGSPAKFFFAGTRNTNQAQDFAPASESFGFFSVRRSSSRSSLHKKATFSTKICTEMWANIVEFNNILMHLAK